jgi:hypothetical protein
MMAPRHTSPVPQAALDLTFVDQRSALLYTWKVETDPWNRDHLSIYIEYNGITGSRKGSKKASGLHNKSSTGLPLQKKFEKIMEVKRH